MSGCPCVSLTFSDLDAACGLVRILVARGRVATAVGVTVPLNGRRASTVLRLDGAAAVELDDNVALYDDVGQLLILLNMSAAAVWERCDGTRSRT